MRWVCGSCGSTKNAPSKPRRDDARRYCFKCSEATGRLVQRVCPALDAKRARKRAHDSATEVVDRSRERSELAARNTIDGLNLQNERDRLWKIAKTIPGSAVKRDMPKPTLVIRKSVTSTHTSGHVRYRTHRIVLTLGTACDRAEAAEVLAHEIAHLMAPVKEAHGQIFHTRLGSLIEAAYGIWMAPVYWRTQQHLRDIEFVLRIRGTEWFAQKAAEQ